MEKEPEDYRDKLIRRLTELGFKEPDILTEMSLQLDKDSIFIAREQLMGRDTLKCEVLLQRDTESGQHYLYGYLAVLLPNGDANNQKRAFFELKGDLTDVSISQAYNLMCGRSVLKFYPVTGKRNSVAAHWLRLEDGHKVYYPGFDLLEKLKGLKVQELVSYDLTAALLQQFFNGDCVRIRQMAVKGLPEAYAEFDPARQRFRLYDASGKEFSYEPKAEVKQQQDKPKRLKSKRI